MCLLAVCCVWEGAIRILKHPVCFSISLSFKMFGKFCRSAPFFDKKTLEGSVNAREKKTPKKTQTC